MWLQPAYAGAKGSISFQATSSSGKAFDYDVSSSKIYVFHYSDDEWHTEGSGEPKTVTVNVDKL